VRRDVADDLAVRGAGVDADNDGRRRVIIICTRVIRR